jgi:hypothetical protein
MMFKMPWLSLTLRIGPLWFDVGVPLPVGICLFSKNLGYAGVGVAAVSWDFRRIRPRS